MIHFLPSLSCPCARHIGMLDLVGICKFFANLCWENQIPLTDVFKQMIPKFPLLIKGDQIITLEIDSSVSIQNPQKDQCNTQLRLRHEECSLIS